jgi:hypothetical protein
MGFEFIQVNIHMTPKPKQIANGLYSKMTGKKTFKYPTKATAIAAFVAHMEIQ